MHSVNLSLPEHQSIDVSLVARAKALDAYRILNKKGTEYPVLIDDAGIYIGAYNGFPGALAKYAKHHIGVNGILRLLDGDMDRSAESVTVIAYCDKNCFRKEEPAVFEEKMSGKIAPFDYDKPFMTSAGFAHIFVPDGASMPFIRLPDSDKEKFSERIIALNRFLDWAKGNIL